MRKTRRFRRSRRLVRNPQSAHLGQKLTIADAKAKAEMAAKAKGSKGPLNTGAQGIKKSGKK